MLIAKARDEVQSLSRGDPPFLLHPNQQGEITVFHAWNDNLAHVRWRSKLRSPQDITRKEKENGEKEIHT